MKHFRRVAVCVILLAILSAGQNFAQELGPAGTPSRGVQSIQGIDGMRPVDVKQSGSSDAWTIQAAHQVVVSHVSSRLHVVLIPSSNLNDVLAVHVSTLGHITSLTHITGLVGIRDDTCPTCKARVDHYNALVNQPHISGAMNAFVVAQCGGTATLALASNANRRDLWLQNGGTTSTTGNIWIGLGATGHVALTAANGFVLHTNSGFSNASPTTRIYLPNYQGPVSCIGETAGSPLQIIETLR